MIVTLRNCASHGTCAAKWNRSQRKIRVVVADQILHVLNVGVYLILVNFAAPAIQSVLRSAWGRKPRHLLSTHSSKVFPMTNSSFARSYEGSSRWLKNVMLKWPQCLTFFSCCQMTASRFAPASGPNKVGALESHLPQPMGRACARPSEPALHLNHTIRRKSQTE